MEVFARDKIINTFSSDAKQANLKLMDSLLNGEKGTEKTPVIATLQDLIAELHRIFSEDDVNVEYVNYVMKSYKSNPSEWKKYAKFDRYRYTRNLVDEGNGKFNLMILCWGEGHGSAIHDHANAHCFMKMLQGELQEVRFAFPRQIRCHDADCDIGKDLDETAEDDAGEELHEIGRTTLETNGVCYINDSLGLHRVENPSHTDPAVSLHLYCPPFNSCKVFNQRTGQCSTCPVTFWSKFGHRRDKNIQNSRAPEDN